MTILEYNMKVVRKEIGRELLHAHMMNDLGKNSGALDKSMEAIFSI